MRGRLRVMRLVGELTVLAGVRRHHRVVERQCFCRGREHQPLFGSRGDSNPNQYWGHLDAYRPNCLELRIARSGDPGRIFDWINSEGGSTAGN